MIEQLILQALQTAALQAITDSSVSDMPARTVGVTGPTPDDGRFVEFVHISNDSADRYWDESRVLQGAFRMIVHWPITGEGAYPPILYAGELAAAFSKDQLLYNDAARVQIIQNPTVTGPIEMPTELLFPVTLAYRCFRA